MRVSQLQIFFNYLSAEQHVSLREADGAWQIVLFCLLKVFSIDKQQLTYPVWLHLANSSDLLRFSLIHYLRTKSSTLSFTHSICRTP